MQQYCAQGDGGETCSIHCSRLTENVWQYAMLTLQGTRSPSLLSYISLASYTNEVMEIKAKVSL